MLKTFLPLAQRKAKVLPMAHKALPAPCLFSAQNLPPPTLPCLAPTTQAHKPPRSYLNPLTKCATTSGPLNTPFRCLTPCLQNLYHLPLLNPVPFPLPVLIFLHSTSHHL